jgi:hypothetical protein
MLRTSSVGVDEPTRAFLEAGSALIIGTVDAGGQPHAGRGWGLDVVAGMQMRLLLDASDAGTLAHAAAGGAIAVTAADVRTLRSVQLKGHAVGVEDATDEDRARSERYCEAFFTDILETDGTPRALTARMVPPDVVACTIEVDELYDQTPGPGAGAPLAER